MKSNKRYYLYKIDGVPSISMRELEENSEELELAMSTEDVQEILSYLKDYPNKNEKIE